MVKVAIVEDDKVIAEELCNYLKEWNFSAVCMDIEKDLIKQLVQEKADIILLDVHLPGVNGISLCRQLRQQLDTPILFISSDADRMQMVSAYEYGGDDYIVKPFDKMVLIAKLNALVRRMKQKQGEMFYAAKG